MLMSLLEDNLSFKLFTLDSCNLEELDYIINYAKKVKEIKKNILVETCPLYPEKTFKWDFIWDTKNNPEELK